MDVDLLPCLPLHTFPSLGLCGQNSQQVFNEGTRQRRKNIPDEAKLVKKGLQRSKKVR